MPKPSYADPYDWMPSGIDWLNLERIGRIAVVWNSIELDLQQLIWTAARWEGNTGPFVTAELSNDRRCKLAKNIILSNYKCPDLIDDAVRSLDYFDQCRIKRSYIVHGAMEYIDHREHIYNLSGFRPRKAGGEINNIILNADQLFLDHLMLDQMYCRQCIEDIKMKIEQYIEYTSKNGSDITDELKSFVFNYADPPLDTAKIQRRLDHLRSVPLYENTDGYLPR